MTTKKDIKFKEFDLSESLLNALDRHGYETATEIQVNSIPILKKGKDLIAQASTGTGKTLAFSIPCIEAIVKEERKAQALIICPTRELAVQVTNEIAKLLEGQEIAVTSIYGGQEMKIQLKALKKGTHIIVGTPGRIRDHVQRGTIRLSSIKYLVLDEADQMLNMGFAEELNDIISRTPETRQTLMFSATLPKPLMKIAQKYLKNAEHINLISESLQQNLHIKQLCLNTSNAGKDSCVEKLLEEYKIFCGIIFCNTKRKVDELTKALHKKKYLVAAIHGDIKQKRRDLVMKNFKQGAVELLIATDVAARGIDVSNLEAVINYDLPKSDEDYIHRIGRTGRAGKSGLAFNLITKNDSSNIRRIANKHKLKLEYS